MEEVFSGSGVALATPFRDGQVDLEAFDRLIDWQLAAGTDALIVLGTTGEPTSLTAPEKALLIDRAVRRASGRARVIAGAGGCCTTRVIEEALLAQRLGADAVLSVTPYYVKCGQAGMTAHFTALADAIDIPVILYNVPSRTGANLSPETAARLTEHPRILGVKEASGSMAQIAAMLEALRSRAAVYCGTDELNAAMLAMGARGVISVTANVVPRRVKRLTEAAMTGDAATAERLQKELAPLNAALFREGNPIPVKAALAMLGLTEKEYRLPLIPPSAETEAALREALEGLGGAEL